jgi:hypothetical protein
MNPFLNLFPLTHPVYVCFPYLILLLLLSIRGRWKNSISACKFAPVEAVFF